MKIPIEKVTLRVIPQRTFSPRTISLVAEESKGHITKGDVVKKISIDTLDRMKRPLSVVVTNRGYTPVFVGRG